MASNTLRIALASIATIAVAAVAAGAPKPLPAPVPPPPPADATVGAAAPVFELTDTDGKTHRLADYAGKIVVLEWFNAGCPFSGSPSDFAVNTCGKGPALRKNLKEVDPTVVYLLIDSSANRDKATVIAEDQAAKKAHKINAPILIDYDGTVGRIYNARTTPHTYVIDANGVLRYSGAFDDDRKNHKGDKATNHVLDAVKSLKDGTTPKPIKTRPWGCSVKYV
jgi:peroxiredoxin